MKVDPKMKVAVKSGRSDQTSDQRLPHAKNNKPAKSEVSEKKTEVDEGRQQKGLRPLQRQINVTGDNLTITSPNRHFNKIDKSVFEFEVLQTLRDSRYLRLVDTSPRNCSLGELLKVLYRTSTMELGMTSPLLCSFSSHEGHPSVVLKLDSPEDKEALLCKCRSVLENKNEFKNIKVMAVFPQLYHGVDNYLRMDPSDAGKLLYPTKEVAYPQQLKEKEEWAMRTVGLAFPHETFEVPLSAAERLSAAAKIRPIVPAPAALGYERHGVFAVERVPQGGTVVGIRIVSGDRKSSGIVPLGDCISVSAAMASVAEAFVAVLPELGLEPYDPATKRGDVTAISLAASAYGKFALALVVPKFQQDDFWQLSDEVISDRRGNEIKIGDLKREDIEEHHHWKWRQGDFKTAMSRYMEKYGKEKGVECVQILFSGQTWTHNTKYLMENSCHRDLAGEKDIIDNLNGMSHYLCSHCVEHVDGLRSLIPLVEHYGNINKSSQVYVISDSSLPGVYLAQNSAYVTAIKEKPWDTRLEDNAKKLGIHNITLTHDPNYKNITSDSTLIVCNSKLTKKNIAKLLSCGIKKVIIIEMVSKGEKANILGKYEKELRKLLTTHEITHIHPVDVAPHKDICALVVFIKAKTDGPVTTVPRWSRFRANQRDLRSGPRRTPIRSIGRSTTEPWVGGGDKLRVFDRKSKPLPRGYEQGRRFVSSGVRGSMFNRPGQSAKSGGMWCPSTVPLATERYRAHQGDRPLHSRALQNGMQVNVGQMYNRSHWIPRRVNTIHEQRRSFITMLRNQRQKLERDIEERRRHLQRFSQREQFYEEGQQQTRALRIAGPQQTPRETCDHRTGQLDPTGTRRIARVVLPACWARRQIPRPQATATLLEGRTLLHGENTWKQWKWAKSVEQIPLGKH